MKHCKHGVLLLGVLIALFVASPGASAADFTASTTGITQDSTYSVTKSEDSVAGTLGLHW
jgi:hypothetical protein